jgi:hypothetical protein
VGLRTRAASRDRTVIGCGARFCLSQAFQVLFHIFGQRRLRGKAGAQP